MVNGIYIFLLGCISFALVCLVVDVFFDIDILNPNKNKK